MEDLGAFALTSLLIGVFAYCMAPREWQTLTGMTVIVAGAVPVLWLALTILSVPAFIIPAAFILGALVSQRRA